MPTKAILRPKIREKPEIARDPRKSEIISYILEGRSYRDAAKMAGITEVTLWRWRTRDAEFIKELDDGRKSRLVEMRSKLDASAMHAIDTVVKAMLDKRVAWRTRLRAAQMILDRAGFEATTPKQQAAININVLPMEREQPQAYMDRLTAMARAARTHTLSADPDPDPDPDMGTKHTETEQEKRGNECHEYSAE